MVQRRTWLSPLLLAISILPSLSVQAIVTEGTASYYADRFDGRRTASGERFDKNALTAAHRTLSFGTKVMVTNKANGRSVEVTINDRGPYAHNRTIDLSKGAAKEIGMLGRGLAKVEIQIVGKGDMQSSAQPDLKVAAAQQIMLDLF